MISNVTYNSHNYSPAANLLDKKVILITGAGAGIGRAAARCYARHGATCILLGRTVEGLEETFDLIQADGSPEAAILPMDLMSQNEEDYNFVAQTIEEQLGQLDGVLHNASILGQRTPIQQYRNQVWLDVMQVNINAVFMLTKALLPLLQQSPSASVLLTSSGVGRQGKAFWGAYAASKFACEGLMQILAAELEETSNIRVNSINPGATNTAMRRAAYPGEKPDTNPSPKDILNTYLYLISNDSLSVTGQAFDR